METPCEVVRHSGPAGDWEFTVWEAAEGGDVPGARTYRGFRLDLARPSRHLMVADKVTVLLGFEGEVTFGMAPTDTGPAGVLLVGPQSRAMETEHDRRLHGMSVALEPWAAFALCGSPMSRLSNAVVRPSDVLGTELRRLLPALRDTTAWPQRFAMVEDLLAHRLAEGPACSPGVVQAWRDLVRSGGTVSVEKLASGVGWCRRNLERRFREQVGLSPKAVARTLRLRRACRLLRRGLVTAEVALACGYYDQAHLVHDVKRITGRTPGELLADGTGREGRPAGTAEGECPPILPGLIL